MILQPRDFGEVWLGTDFAYSVLDQKTKIEYLKPKLTSTNDRNFRRAPTPNARSARGVEEVDVVDVEANRGEAPNKYALVPNHFLTARISVRIVTK